MAYSSMDSAIILKGTRHGLLASVREDSDWREVLRELTTLSVQNSEFLKDAQLVLDFGWREVTEEQFDSILAVLQTLGLGCNGILSTSLNTRTIAESRGYRAIIGRLGLAQHQGRRLRRDQEATPAPEVAPPQVVVHAVSQAPAQVTGQPPVSEVAAEPASAPIPRMVAQSPAAPAHAPVEAPLPEPRLSEVLSYGEATRITAPSATSLEVVNAHPDAQPSVTMEPVPELIALAVAPKSTTSPEADSIEEGMDPLHDSSEENGGYQTTFDSADPIVANLPTVFDSSELDGGKAFSSSHEPGIHIPHYQDEEPTLYIRKTLRSGQRVVFAGNVVLLGDLNPGAQIEADGDVIVLGQLRGSVHAGCEGDQDATVITSSMRATQLRIADRFFKAESGNRFFRKTPPTGTLRARLDGDTVVVEALPVR